MAKIVDKCTEREGFGIEIPLKIINIIFTQPAHLILMLDAFRHRLDPHLLGHINNAVNQRRRSIRRNLINKHPIYFYAVGIQAGYPGEIRKTGAKIIERNRNTVLADNPDLLQNVAIQIDLLIFGKLEGQSLPQRLKTRAKLTDKSIEIA